MTSIRPVLKASLVTPDHLRWTMEKAATLVMLQPSAPAREPTAWMHAPSQPLMRSFGVVLYEMATGTLPFTGDTAGAIFDAILHKPPTPAVRLNPGLLKELDDIIDKALQKDLGIRYQHASEMRADLTRAKRDSGSTGTVAAHSRKTALAQEGSRTLRPKAIGSLVVLPFVNESGDPDADYLGQGIARQLSIRFLRLKSCASFLDPRRSISKGQRQTLSGSKCSPRASSAYGTGASTRREPHCQRGANRHHHGYAVMGCTLQP